MKKLIFRGGVVLFILSLNLYSQWEQCSNGMNSGSVFTLLEIVNNIYAATSSGIYVSPNHGSNWLQMSFVNQTVYSIVTKGNYIFVSTVDSGVYRSSDNGATWIQTSLNSGIIHSLIVNGSDIYAASQGTVFKSGDNGQTWETVYVTQYSTISSLCEYGNTVFVGQHGVFITTNNGSNWLQTMNTYPNIVNSLASRSGNVFAGAYGVFRSTNNGVTWNLTSLNNYYVRALCVNNTATFAGTSDHGVYVSNNNGASWMSKSEGLGTNPPIIRCLYISGGYLFAGTWQQNIYRRSLDELTGIRPMSSGIPGSYSLHQNYPNPFNPSTMIRVDIPYGVSSANTRLAIYDISGKEVCTLLNESMSSGSYEIEWNAGNYPSGVYYYRLTTDGFSDTKRMIIIK